MEDIAGDYVDRLTETRNPKNDKSYAPGYIDSCLKAIKSWAVWNRKEFKRKIKIADRNKRPTLENERIPTQEELGRVLYADTTPIRTRVNIALMSFSGPRPEVQGDYQGLDGLRIKDLPEMEVKEKEVIFTKIPTTILVRAELSKTGYQYHSFLCDEGCEILKTYLDRRMIEGEELNPATPVVATSESQAKRSKNLKMKDASPFLATAKISEAIRQAMRAIGLPWRPYVFRSYFDTYMLVAENKGLVSHPYVQYWMGHSGDIEAAYSTQRRQLPPEMIEGMRDSYEKASQLLRTKLKPSEKINEEKQKVALNERLLAVSGYKSEEIQAMNAPSMSDEQVADAIRKRLFGAMVGNGSRQKLAALHEVDTLLQQGYECKFVLQDGRVVMQLPF